MRSGVLSSDEALLWLDPRLTNLPSPEDLSDLDGAVERIERAVGAGERIAVYGDYDVDGLTSTFLLTDFLRRSGAEVVSTVPDRLSAGYGVNSEAVRSLHRQGVGLIVTVDCGISNHEQIEEAMRLGVDVIVTDHHLLPASLPPALAVVNPKRLSPDHPLFDMAGVGVAFYLAVALRKRFRDAGRYRGVEEPNLREYLDLVALGTVADMAPLRGVNRIFARHGLGELSRASRPAIAALRNVAGLREGEVTPWDIHFRLAPRINAASRMGRQDLVLSWLSSREVGEASAIALRMEDLNRKRAAIEEEIFDQASERIEKDPSLAKAAVVVLADPRWHAGILGIVASRIVERWGKPAVLLTSKGDCWEGSGRSVEGFSLHRALVCCQEHLERYGGHAMAVGLRLRENSLDGFRACLERHASESPGDISIDSRLHIDARLPLSKINRATMSWLERLGPFGYGCPEPLFYTEGLAVHRHEVVRDQHLRLVLGQNGIRFPAIAFRMAPYLPRSGERMDRLKGCIFVPMRKVWAGKTDIQLRVLDFSL